MDRTQVDIYQERPGNVPLLKWLDGVLPKVQEKYTALFEMLEEKGNELRRPRSAPLVKDVHELRGPWKRVQYRVLYGFVGKGRALLSHGCIKPGQKMPKKEINRALRNLSKYLKNRELHTYIQEES